MRKKTPENMITVVMDDSCLETNAWAGKIGAALGGRLFHNFCNDAMLGSCIVSLKKEILHIIQNEV